MAYDSKTYGQSPFGSSKKAEGTQKGEANAPATSGKLPSENLSSKTPVLADDGLDKGPEPSPGLASKFPSIPLGKLAGAMANLDSPTVESTTSPRKSRSNKSVATADKTVAKTTAKTTKRKSKKAKAAEAEAEAAEAAVAQRFLEEDRKTYLSLLYKIGISGLVWAVLRLLRHELSDETVAIVNALIDPMMIATITLIGLLALTFWMRSLLKDISLHTQQLYTDAEQTEGKNYRPTLEIVGDSLEYNPKLRKHLATFYNVASTLICSLISYLVTFALFKLPTD